MNIRFGYIHEYQGSRGFGFLRDALDCTRSGRGSFFHIKIIKRKYAAFAQIVDSGAWHDVLFWYCTEPSIRGRGDEVVDLWLTAEELPSDARSGAQYLLSRYWKNLQAKPSLDLEMSTKALFGETALANLRAEYDRKQQEIRAEEEARERIQDEQRRRQEVIKLQSEAIRRQQAHEINEKRWTGFLERPFDHYVYYWETHKELIRKGKLKAPDRTGHAVTDFTDWIYSLYIPEKNKKNLQRGREYENDVRAEKVQQERRLSVDKDWITIPEHSDWQLIYNGMSTSSSAPLRISALTIKKSPIFGRPDLVFKQCLSGRILILEIKISEAAIPDGGWPNLRAQLWAYSKIDKWAKSSDILLVGEIWGFENGLRLRRAMRWRPQELEEDNMQLYNLYRLHAERKK